MTTTIDDTQIVFNEMKTKINHENLSHMVSLMNAVSDECNGDGAGLSCGLMIDMILTKLLPTIIDTFESCHVGESDCKILNVPVSIKTINGKSTIALDWSKNGDNSIKRERFNTPIMIINRKTQKWWITSPRGKKSPDFYSTQINAGIYLVSPTYCKENVTLVSNNKTNSLIKDVPLYHMLKDSIKNNTFIEFPTDVPKRNFKIQRALD